MRKWIFSSLVALASASVASAADHHGHCEGFLPKNDMRIPIGANLLGGITKTQFNQVLDRIEALYADEVRARGGTLSIDRDWKNTEVNAYADQQNGKWMLKMFGGLARHSAITKDGFAVVACHEIGHHLGGAPKYRDSDWATNEGQADYYSTLKCMRRYFEQDDNERIIAGMKLDSLAVSNCRAQHVNQRDEAICIRSAMAGLSLANLFRDLSRDKAPKFGTPDRSKVKETYDPHPMSQCRLDTYFQGSLCTVPVYRHLSDRDYREGSCIESTHTVGLRPRCWFKPN